MSTVGGDPTGRFRDVLDRTPLERDAGVMRIAALAATLLVLGSYLTVLYYVVDVVGDPNALLLVVGATLVAATPLAGYLTMRRAVGVSLGMLALGLAVYLVGLPKGTLAIGPHIQYTIALLSGTSILEIVNLRMWVLGITPGPVFVTWYLSLRRRYGAASLVGGATVAFFVLTGDVSFPVAMIGSIGALALVGLGTLDRAGARARDIEVVSIVLAVIVIASLAVSIVPQGGIVSYSPSTGLIVGSSVAGGGAGNTVEATLLSDPGEFKIQGSIELSPKVRWTVESDGGDYWRVGAYDLYTGDGWVRRAESESSTQSLDDPPGRSRQIRQTFTAETPISTMPAAWRPIEVGGDAADAALATEYGSLTPRRTLDAGDSYTVTSELPVATGRQLQDAGTDYPERIERRYLQLPDSTPDRVRERTSRLTARASTSYETALTIENWLQNNREYSLDVPEPDNNVADQFLFEREEGYCVYFATTMAVMLRSQGIPARMVVGYTPGERVDQDRWVVRGYNAHAWVEAYFPDVGWVRFDPTPAGPREVAETERLNDARQNNASNVDTDDTRGPEYDPGSPNVSANSSLSLPGTGQVPEEALLTPGQDPSNAPDVEDNSSGGDGGFEDGLTSFVSTLEPPSREEVVFGLVTVFGLVAGVRRSGVSGRVYREARLRFQRRIDPETDVQRAGDRLELLLSADHRDRRRGETLVQYLDAVDADDRATEVAKIRERARYAGEVTEADADRAVDLVEDLVAAGS